jgi:hypothetical protein
MNSAARIAARHLAKHTLRADVATVNGVDHTASIADELEVVRVDPIRAGFGGAGMLRSLSRGKPHDPREVVSVEVTLSGTPEALVARSAAHLAQAEARRHGVYGGMVRRAILAGLSSPRA